MFAGPQEGRITPYKSTHLDRVEYEAKEWADFLGVCVTTRTWVERRRQLPKILDKRFIL
jgi:hypothetical protein